MNLDLFPLGWVHLIASLAALVVATSILLRAKATPDHKQRGRIYVTVILVTSTTALGIYRLGVFFFPHWFAIASLLTTVLGFAAARYKVPRIGWVHVHLTCMLTSVYILVGGGVNEFFLRVHVLRRFVPSLNSPIVGMTHLAMMASFTTLIVYFNIREWQPQGNRILTPDPKPEACGTPPGIDSNHGIRGSAGTALEALTKLLG
jgi:uncharacterized membrane protein